MKLGVEAALVDGRRVPGDVEVTEGRVARVGISGRNGRGLASPGFIDLQVNGFGGIDFLHSDAAGYRRAGEALLGTGVTAYLPTFITSPEDQLLAAVDEVPLDGAAPRILGIHLEGPFLAPGRLGAHPPAARRDPDPLLLERLLASRRIRLMTLAPELKEADVLIDHLLRLGVTVSCGHTDATAEEANAAFDRGVRTVTHLFNAMRPLRHRDPGIAGAALARDDVVVQIILDGVHLARETAGLVWRAAAGRVALVTDAVSGAGGQDGSCSLGGVEVKIQDGVVRGPDGQLAGSVLTMIEAVRNLHALGAPLGNALEAASTVPAGALGLPDLGKLEPGAPADIVVVDDNLQIARVLVGGQEYVAA